MKMNILIISSNPPPFVFPNSLINHSYQKKTRFLEFVGDYIFLRNSKMDTKFGQFKNWNYWVLKIKMNIWIVSSNPPPFVFLNSFTNHSYQKKLGFRNLLKTMFFMTNSRMDIPILIWHKTTRLPLNCFGKIDWLKNYGRQKAGDLNIHFHFQHSTKMD